MLFRHKIDETNLRCTVGNYSKGSDEQTRRNQMVTRNHDLLMLALSRFFSTTDTVKKLLQVIEGKSTVSLRLLDYFVTNYAKKHKTTLQQAGAVTCVHSNYRSQLKAFSKQQFDPFRRRERIIFEFENHHTIETTVGQLNFFRWAIESGVLQYVMDNKDVIETDMYNTSSCTVPKTDEDENSRKNKRVETDDEEEAQPPEPAAPAPTPSHQLHVKKFHIPTKVTFD